MIKQILVPLDGSSLAESILPAVRELAHLSDATVTLLYVVEAPHAKADDATEAISAVAHDLLGADESDAIAYVSQLSEQLRRDGLTIQTRVAAGPVAETILTSARAFDLVAMATHGRSGLGRWVYGSVADAVLRSVSVPVLLFRATTSATVATGHPRHILVPLDGSPLAEQALPLAIDLAQRAGARLHLVRSINWVTDYAGANAYLMGDDSAGLIDSVDEGAQEYLAVLAQRLAAPGLKIDWEVRVETAADTILDAATDKQVDLIVMSTHGRGGLTRLVYGSVAGRVLHSATVPVLLVRTQPVLDDPPTAEMVASDHA